MKTDSSNTQMAFTNSLLNMYDYIIEYNEQSRLPSFLRRLAIRFMINKIINTYKDSLDKVSLNFGVMHDFSRFYLNTIEKVNSAFMYKNLHKGFKDVISNPKFARFTLKSKQQFKKYNIVFRDDGDIEIKEYDNDGAVIFIDHGTINNKDTEKMLKDEMITYISYFVRTYCF